MTKFYETEKFKKLNQRWQEKIKKSGFEDAEQPDGLLKKWSSGRASVEKHQVLRETKELYYRLACQFLHEHSFRNQLDYTVWRLHSEGVSFVKIEKQVGKGRGAAQKIVERLRILMRNSVKNNMVQSSESNEDE